MAQPTDGPGTVHLQIPGGPELPVVVVLVAVVSVAVAAGAAYWVYRDATRRGRDDATTWGALTVIGFLVASVGGVAVLVRDEP